VARASSPKRLALQAPARERRSARMSVQPREGYDGQRRIGGKPNKPALAVSKLGSWSKARNLEMGESSRERGLAFTGGKPWSAAGRRSGDGPETREARRSWGGSLPHRWRVQTHEEAKPRRGRSTIGTLIVA
jgi:hypothetical protein